MTKRISKSAKKWIANALKKGLSRNRIYVQKHYDVLGYLYENEQTEINIMAETVNRLVKKES